MPNGCYEEWALLAKVGQPVIDMLSLAARAPSGHNTQPWTIRFLTHDHWLLGIEPSRRLSGIDPTACQTLLSLGAFLENLILAATHFGYALEYAVIARSTAAQEIIDLRLHPVDPVQQYLEAIRLRRTLRNGYLPRELLASDLSSILRHGEEFHYFPRGSAQANYLAQGTLEANRQQTLRTAAIQELANWIRWSPADRDRFRNGLTPASMEIKGMGAWYVSHFFNRASVLSRSFQKSTEKQLAERVAQGAGWLVVTSPDNNISTLIETGRKVQRMWLLLGEKKIAVHPLMQMLEEAPWSNSMARGLGLDGVAQFVLRIGYVDSYPKPASVRMPVAWFASQNS